VTARSDLRARLAPLLEAARGEDGGFGWAVGAEPEPEPTALATLALDDDGAREWLLAHQNDDGGFALPTGEPQGSATTPLVALALPEGEGLQRAIQYTLTERAVQVVDGAPTDEVEGWGWTPTTYAWVEPTARALLLFLRRAPTERAAIDEARRVLAEREIEGGGWNYGNSSARGTDLHPYVQTTAAAVMALQGDTTGLLERGRDLLVEQAPTEPGGLSLAMSLVALRLQAEEPYDELVALLSDQHDRTAFLGNVGSLAWAVLATGDDLDPFRVPS
jgi:hypothetical protein